MFKKRTRPASVREKTDAPSLPNPDDLPVAAAATEEAGPSAVAESSTASGSTAAAAVDEDEPQVGSTIQELLSLRRFRAQSSGLALDKLNRGEVRRRKARAAAAGGEGGEEGEEGDGDGGEDGQPKIVAGLVQGKGSKPAEDENPDDPQARMKRLMNASNFTQQTNALDVDKHMMAYIEAELLKRRGVVPTVAELAQQKPHDPYEELYAIADEYKVAKGGKTEKEMEEREEKGDVMASMAMLSAIPEVDLGMDTRLKNIESTEKAKRAMLEARKNAPRPMTDAEHDFAAARFYRPTHHIQSDSDALVNAQRAAAGLPPVEPKKGGSGGGGGRRKDTATDEVVMERFKKRIRKM